MKSSENTGCMGCTIAARLEGRACLICMGLRLVLFLWLFINNFDFVYLISVLDVVRENNV